jgi:branched-chain amino acid transport system ATP-binding protein
MVRTARLKNDVALQGARAPAARAGPEPPAALVDVRGLRAGYGGADVLRDVTFALSRSGTAAVLGANGAGKTTLLRALCGMIAANGSVTLDGEPLIGLTTEQIAARGVAHVPEGRGTFAQLTVEENLRLGAWLLPNRRAALTERERLLEYFPRLRERFAQQAGTLSGGEQQMLAIARALQSRPRLLLLDEPSFGLAPAMVSEVFELLAKLRAEYGLAMLLVEQHVSLALELADRLFILEDARLEPVQQDASALEPALRGAYLGR